ncbi:uncharacterized protein LOC112403484 isoform X4 [Neophocaena asiaeorientalis asiaeorientalis]|uniref:Uncharacterized protein LOC112403484 isoform X4 n=1 Tax=Neophocaena asiaeorientalis asiaeorientalis TaxID=1706337 RepID=A0A341BVL7_NEOAA|nr:uncharacterized protein LOC112403484 isoform X4 [Neophocaena asiaeorientalis asiaeorientalis]XP_024606736.1 uncharacterized protein LOC112403484 isoform X4 [Neophocaena asiaeorientalis asiaeorientalis]XP_024606737.1 uncharacterized protein LOC112403484 isoform X4 [Neophocaena asiaeorientalis asiaeorientalis]XP_024606738.1 uncharacterized protein LOC112403484 isoform X4 [Neophocaena asiaeorientalis asiaeorientalis]XP_024606739.1 uncharacterized protein LOC112403484 isoform X4 [Neophocaena asi
MWRHPSLVGEPSPACLLETRRSKEARIQRPPSLPPRSPETSIPSGRKMDDLGSTSGAPPPLWLELASVISRRPSGWVPGRASCFQPHEITWLLATRGQNQHLVSENREYFRTRELEPKLSRAVETTEAPGCWRTKQVSKHRLLAEPGVLSSPPKFNVLYSQ